MQNITSAVLLCLHFREWNMTDKWIKVYAKSGASETLIMVNTGN
jgi:hypothetical protein